MADGPVLRPKSLGDTDRPPRLESGSSMCIYSSETSGSMNCWFITIKKHKQSKTTPIHSWNHTAITVLTYPSDPLQRWIDRGMWRLSRHWLYQLSCVLAELDVLLAFILKHWLPHQLCMIITLMSCTHQWLRTEERWRMGKSYNCVTYEVSAEQIKRAIHYIKGRTKVLFFISSWYCSHHSWHSPQT